MKHPDLSWNAFPAHACRYRRWLVERGSLTRAIQKRCKDFSVRHVSQNLARPCLDEIRLLDLRSDGLCLVREVFLYCGNTPVVFAHSIVRREALDGAWHALNRLGGRPLGEALFSNPLVGRDVLRCRRLDRRHALYRRASRLSATPPRALWARRSLYQLQGVPLLVTEVFLPSILELAV